MRIEDNDLINRVSTRGVCQPILKAQPESALNDAERNKKMRIIGLLRFKKFHAFIVNSEFRKTLKMLLAFAVGWAAWHTLSSELR